MSEQSGVGRIPGLLGAFRERSAQERIDVTANSGEGLRERKKRLTRQLISDTATAMFLDRGFDEVRVSEVAAACGVSEKTVFNYFSTKESLLLDREEAMTADIRRALGPEGSLMSPIDAAVSVIVDQLRMLYGHWDDEPDGPSDISVVVRFFDLIESTPSLRAAQHDMMDRILEVAAEAMAARARMDPADPEPQIAAHALVGLWRIAFRAVKKYSDGTHQPAAVRELAIAEVRRAARLIDTGLWSFGIAVQGKDGREQLKAAAEAANEARKQVMAAIKQARDAWRVVVAEAHRSDEMGGRPGRPGSDLRELRRLAHQQQRGGRDQQSGPRRRR